jgi:hypothetical protein
MEALMRAEHKTAIACSVLLLAACQQGTDRAAPQGVSELAWARVALERNPNLEVMATDTQAGVFTVRDKATGEVRTVTLGEIAAVPVAMLTKAPAPAGGAPSTRPTQPESTAAETTSQEETPEEPEQSAQTTAGPMNYTIERSDGQVKVSGPGVSIVSSGSSAATTPGREPGQSASDPIICEGRRLLHLDNRNIYVQGDALTARGGCELHVTNSRIVASGTGLVVHGASVHISNSSIEGATASYDADGSAKIFVRGSTITGVPRRHQYAVVQDLGGNEFRQGAAAANNQ